MAIRAENVITFVILGAVIVLGAMPLINSIFSIDTSFYSNPFFIASILFIVLSVVVIPLAGRSVNNLGQPPTFGGQGGFRRGF